MTDEIEIMTYGSKDEFSAFMNTHPYQLVEGFVDHDAAPDLQWVWRVVEEDEVVHFGFSLMVFLPDNLAPRRWGTGAIGATFDGAEYPDCPGCGWQFEYGQAVRIATVIHTNGETTTLPMHLECADMAEKGRN